MIRQSFRKLPAVFARLTGQNGTVREYRALVNPASEYCAIPTVDALALGYPVAAGRDPRSTDAGQLYFASYGGYGRGVSVKMVEVSIAGTTFKDVEFVTFDVSQASGFDVVLGKSLLEGMRVELDYGTHQLSLERAVAARP